MFFLRLVRRWEAANLEELLRNLDLGKDVEKQETDALTSAVARPGQIFS